MKYSSSALLFSSFLLVFSTHALLSQKLPDPFLPGAKAQGWMEGGNMVTEKDGVGRALLSGKSIKDPAWLLSEYDISGNYRIEALVQLVPTGEGKNTRWTTMTLAWGAKAKGNEVRIHREIGYTGDKIKGYRLFLIEEDPKKKSIPSPDGLGVTRAAVEESLASVPHTDRNTILESSRVTVGPSTDPKDISPAWDEQFRLAAERSYANMPDTASVWAKITIDVTPQWARVYRDGFFFQEFPAPPATSGRILAIIPSGVHLASLKVTKSDPAADLFYPIPLDEMINAKGDLDDKSLPEPGVHKVLNGIPFLFPPRDGKGDHVDIGRSLFGSREATGSYDSFTSARVTWQSASMVDPNRLMLRVPNRPYQRLWVVAAAEEKPGTLPILTARFFKPLAGYAVDAEVEIPEFTATGKNSEIRRVEVSTKNGKKVALWVVPIDLDTGKIASRFRDRTFLDIELTKKIYDYRPSPDPIVYDSFQGGLPSSVQLYAATLEEAPFAFLSDGTEAGKTYVSPATPDWVVDVRNLSEAKQDIHVVLDVSGPDGFTQQLDQKIHLDAGKTGQVKFAPKPQKFGHYKVRTTVSSGDLAQSQDGAFLFLPPDKRKADAKTSRWGLWYWLNHEVNTNHEENLKILHAIGARTGNGAPYELRKKYGIGPASEKVSRARELWTMESPDDPKARAAYVEKSVENIKKHLEKSPDLEYLLPYAEQMISLRISHGMPPSALGEKPFSYDKAEEQRKKAYLVQVQAVQEAVKKVSSSIDLMLGSCSAVFAIPLMEDGVPEKAFNGIGLDLPQFERMPERQPRATEPSLFYFNKEARDRLGYKDKPYHHFESYFPSSHPLAIGERGHANSIVRTAVLSLALGTERFIECWTFQDPSDYWGSSHYAGCGLYTREPEFDPKPGAAAFATMTQVLDTAKFDGYLSTGSWSSYVVRFKDPDKLIYAMWTFNGTRPITVTASEKTKLVRIDESGNETPVPLTEGKATLELSPTPFWLIATGGAVESVALGEPSYDPPADAPTVLLEDFQKGDWKYTSDPLPDYAENHWDVRRLPGTYDSAFVESPERGGRKVFKISLVKAGEGPMVGWYGVFTPPKPLEIPGKANALGIWAKGNSGWGRVIYELEDANGQILRNIGNKDQFNCDDIHSWSYLHFDGWKYIQFPLPGNLPADNYREKDSVWWSHSEGNPVKLPLKLTRIIVEMPTHIIYINDMVEVKNQGVELSDLMAVYDSEEMKSDLPIQQQNANAGVFLITNADTSTLPNPIKDLALQGVGAPTKIENVIAPETQNDGTRAKVKVQPAQSAKSYKIWISAYPDGAGAKETRVTPDKENPTSLLVKGLAPSVPLYLFVSYLDQDGKESKPSPGRKVILKDEFPFK